MNPDDPTGGDCSWASGSDEILIITVCLDPCTVGEGSYQEDSGEQDNCSGQIIGYGWYNDGLARYIGLIVSEAIAHLRLVA